MSNLSELLPAGAGAKSAEFVASGTLGSGVTVALQSDGTVEAISATSVSQVVGSSAVFETGSTEYIASAYDSLNNKIVISYMDGGNSNYGTSVVGTVSGTNISFGTPVVFESASTQWISTAFDSSAGKIVIAYKDSGNANAGTAIVGTVSGTSISFGTPVVFNGATVYTTTTYDISNNKIVIIYSDNDNSNYGTGIVGTVSGTSISFGTEVVFNSANSFKIVSVYDSANSKVVTFYGDNGNSNAATAIVGTVSGTSISFGAESVWTSNEPQYMGATFDTSAQKIVLAWTDAVDGDKGKAIVGTVSGTSISFGTSVTFNNASTRHNSPVYNSFSNTTTLGFRDNADSGQGKVIIGTVSGTDISFGSEIVFSTGSTAEVFGCFDSTGKVCVFGYQNGSASFRGEAFVFQNAYTLTNSADFIGITDQAIADTATGAVIVQGGVSDKASAKPVFSSGTPIVFEEATSVYIASAFDSTNNKVVIAYQDNGNSNYGTAIVGTVSGSTISFGTPVIFQSQVSSWISAAFDSSNSKVVIAYRRELSGFNRVNSVVGTVSGTNITFGSIVTVTGNDGDYTSTVFDSNANKVVIAYRDLGNSSYGTAIVGTVSGTSISYGTPVVFEAATSYYISSAFDSNENKIVLSYRDGGNTDAGTSVVGTVSGSTISFGTPVAYSTDTSFSSTVFDSNSNKIIISYRHNGNSSAGTAIVGTVSGTTISFGSPVVFDSADSQYISATFDTTLNKVVVAYKDSGNSNYGTATIGSVNGTNITFSDYIVFEESIASNWITTTFDSNLNKVIVSYANGENFLNYGTSAVITGDASLTPNTDYYVQADGSLSTTVSSVPAGRALSSTSILLEG